MSLVVEKFITTGFGWNHPAPNSQKCYRNHIAQFEAFLEDRNKTASDGTVTDQDIADYLERLKAKYQPNTVATKIAVIKSYFKFLKREGTLTHHPMIRSQRSVKPEHKELKTSDITAITRPMTSAVGSLRQRDLAMFSLIVHCGFKTSEVVAINTEDVDFETGTIGKIKRPFHVALTSMTAYRAGKFQDNKPWIAPENSDEKEPFFLNKFSTRISARSVRRQILGKSSPYTMRDVRHTYLKNADLVKA